MCSVWLNFKLLRSYILLYTVHSVQCNVAQILSNNAPLYAKIKITLGRIYSREINALTIKIICRRNKFPEAIDVLYSKLFGSMGAHAHRTLDSRVRRPHHNI